MGQTVYEAAKLQQIEADGDLPAPDNTVTSFCYHFRHGERSVGGSGCQSSSGSQSPVLGRHASTFKTDMSFRRSLSLTDCHRTHPPSDIVPKQLHPAVYAMIVTACIIWSDSVLEDLLVRNFWQISSE
ncbi:hypothetical protein PoB_000275400 [Plakobranchus ocellatus]|uniref:Uncharacterized protein n=1 Tax=Plakobranchus ocellatus TaxID=259542 RepID=A0AAV3Y1X6_9GAST|nr:hypothetical protein PoB_000275400 [Plakobranchus ocellatus]